MLYNGVPSLVVSAAGVARERCRRPAPCAGVVVLYNVADISRGDCVNTLLVTVLLTILVKVSSVSKPIVYQ